MLEKPSLPHRHKRPLQCDDGEPEDHFYSEMKSFYQQSYYYEVNNSIQVTVFKRGARTFNNGYSHSNLVSV